MPRNRVIAGLVFTLLAAVLASGLAQWRPVQTLDRLFYDSRLRFQTAETDERILIVDIDEKSLAETGRWPWSRSTMASLLDNIAGAKAIGVDILFAERQENPEQVLLGELQADPALASLAPKLKSLAQRMDHDHMLARALRERPVALGYYFTNDRDGRQTGQLPVEMFPAATLTARGWRLSDWDGYAANLAELTRNAPVSGFFNPKIDDDGVLRELLLLVQHKGRAYESLALATLRTYLGKPGAPASLLLDNDGLRIGKLKIPATDAMTVLVPFAGAGGPHARRFRYVSASDVINQRVPAGLFQDKLVLIGTSTVGLTDLRATPVSAVYPGVEVQASLISGALNGAIKTHPPGAGLLASLFTVLLGGILTLSMPRVSALGVLAISVLAIACIFSFHAIAYSGLGWVVSVAPALLLSLTLAALYAFIGYFFEGRTRAQIAERFGEYVSPQIVKRMLDDPKQVAAKSENRELTLLFADIRGFTRNAETMQPEALHEYINRFLTSMTDVIHSYHGTVDKYMGDAVMAFWGAPLSDQFHADNAVSCAVAMQQEAARLNQEFRENGLPELVIGIGINTGRVLVGEMGSKRRRTYTAIGDAVNLASRLEQLTKQYDAKIIVGESTMKAARGHLFHELGSVLVSGRMESAVIFEPVSKLRLGAAADDDELQGETAFESALETTRLSVPRSMQRVA